MNDSTCILLSFNLHIILVFNYISNFTKSITSLFYIHILCSVTCGFAAILIVLLELRKHFTDTKKLLNLLNLVQ